MLIQRSYLFKCSFIPLLELVERRSVMLLVSVWVLREQSLRLRAHRLLLYHGEQPWEQE